MELNNKGQTEAESYDAYLELKKAAFRAAQQETMAAKAAANHAIPTDIGDEHEAVTFHKLPESVGDINSTLKGSGARYNSGKTPLDLLPLALLASAKSRHYNGIDEVILHAIDALGTLGDYQARDGNLIDALDALGSGGWPECAAVFAYGKKKYAAWNWAKGMAWSVPLACAARHLVKIIEGETLDPESGLPHRGHVFCNIVMLITYADTFPEGDDLPGKGMLK